VKFGPVPLGEAEGRILGHNVAGRDGRRVLRKGRPLAAADLDTLRALGRSTIYVALPEPGDVLENKAASRVAAAAAGRGFEASPAAAGRANVLARERGVLRFDRDRLTRWNLADGVTIATLAPGAAVEPRQLAATVKIVPYAVPGETLGRIEKDAAGGGPLLNLDPLPPRRVALLLSGSASAAERVRRDFEGPLARRIEALGSRIERVEFVPLEDESGERTLARAIEEEVRRGAGLVLLAGETAIVDRQDIAPRAIERAGGTIEAFGAPVDPGNLLLLAYVGAVPVGGAPGCARSRKANVVDELLPRLLSGERVGRRDLAAFGAGGLLEDVPERPMPRHARPPASELDPTSDD
jgi:molybdenum cofactor cytidylyltransferase